jgi:hypothetical protein
LKGVKEFPGVSLFCDGKAVVLPSAKEGIAAVGSCQIYEDYIKVWAMIWYFA